jgi:hypothetical protein
MLAPARHADAQDFAHDAFDFQDRYVPAELHSGDRICPAPDACSGNGLLRAYFFIFVVLAGGWMLFDAQSVRQIWTSATAAIAPFASYSAPAQNVSAPAPASSTAGTNAAPTPAVADSAPAIQPLNSREVTIAPSASDEAPQSQSADSSTSDSDGHAQAQDQENEHLTPDQTRASQVGLNPGLSPVILAQLSRTDYRNAAIAIRTALAKTPDGEVFVWPHQRNPELALFRVRFVAGAAPDCRRYVVTITKHRWSTTALPMEKCGSAGRRNASAQ